MTTPTIFWLKGIFVSGAETSGSKGVNGLIRSRNRTVSEEVSKLLIEQGGKTDDRSFLQSRRRADFSLGNILMSFE